MKILQVLAPDYNYSEGASGDMPSMIAVLLGIVALFYIGWGIMWLMAKISNNNNQEEYNHYDEY